MVVTICLIPLIGVLAFAMDGGLILASKRRTQTVADSAAHAAACRLYANLTADPTGLDVSGKANAAALLNAKDNGFNNDGSTNKVTIHIPPNDKTSTFYNLPGYAQVNVVYIQQRIFGTVLGSGSMSISAQTIARGVLPSAAPYSTASVILLEPTAASSLSVIGSGHINAQSTIQINSSSASAAVASNAGYASAPSIQITGNYSTNSSGYFTTTKDSSVRTATPAISDPLASITAPTTSGLTSQSFTSTYGSKTISPGVYSGGISMGNGMTITMLPGIYYMKSGSFTVASGVTLKGDGVTIFMDNGGGQLNLQGGASVTLTPPTTGTYAGMTYFQDRSSTQPLLLGNGSGNAIAGTVYAAAAAAQVVGGTSNHFGSQFVVKTMAISNAADLEISTTSDASKGYIASGFSGPKVTIVQ